jgi:peptidoglycan/LPS O-acetylase OafA/YrhL
VKRIAEFDGLRALAVTAVILFHADRGGPFQGGWIGVDLFFVLSGFLITSILASEVEQTNELRVGRFYWRRFCRLMPALLFMLAGYLLVAPLLWPGQPHGREALLAGLYLSDYSVAIWRIPEIIGHTWSLSVEEHFYLLWPLVLVPLVRTGKPLTWLVPAYVAFTLWRWLFFPDTYALLRFDTHLTGILLGAIVYFAKPELSRQWCAGCLAILLGLCLFVGPDDGAASWVAITLAELASAGAVASIASGQGSRFLAARPMVAVGVMSYAMYLWHYPFAVYVRPHWDFLPTAAATMAFSIVMAAVSYYTVEALGRRLRGLHETVKADHRSSHEVARV